MVNPQRDRTKRIVGLTFTLVLAALLLPEVIIEDGGWRAWLGTLATVGLLADLVDEIRIVRRRRKAATQQQSAQTTPVWLP
ncbi:hypothetical protein [Actinoplanes xinjiangensis]|uniref:Uncharacterized protein n=1 Tax=Actinoplanes xinjiangensis TaxID=512350 RepID=A0A316FER9_9ACTN|nr:hypothetical protein [Actinoplanes xinjiangensis]PWK36130.1 hypothetical protein BC793_124111 [Actinoplanes xinjiangensis]GIF42864.1 hypothetical protein Axi01nite_71750 [Actinoplanes xinjiangensis]